MTSRWERFAPLTGVLFVALTVVGFAVGGDSPELDESSQKVVEFYRDNEGANTFACVLLGLAAIAVVFFASSLRSAFRSSEGGTGWISAVVLGGGVVAASGFATAAGVHFALVAAANEEKLDPGAVQALHALDFNYFFPFGIGVSLLLLAAGLATIMTRALPVWLGWIAIAIFVVSFTPLGFFGFLASGVWVLIASVVLFMRSRAAAAAA